jgi:cell surface protein SprA
VYSKFHTLTRAVVRSIIPIVLLLLAALLAVAGVFAFPESGSQISTPQDPSRPAVQDTSKTKLQLPQYDQFGRPIVPPAQQYDQFGRPILPAADTTRRDTTKRDTLTTVQKKFEDTTYVVCLDSSARLRQFNYRRQDASVVEVFPRRIYPLFATPRSMLYRREVNVDSTGEALTIREKVGVSDVRIPVSVPLKEYIRQRMKEEFRAGLAQVVRQPKAITQRDDLGQLLSNITQITIPIPANPIFSIFGKQEIKLNIGGAVDIKAGFRNTKSDQTTISRLDQSRNEPDFSQEVQVNVSGTIGDKLNILADWNTRRTFEYENQLKIKYTGYDDEIVQSVEAGNVSLSTPSSFVGSSQALFGIKAKFQLGPLTLTTIASQKKGQIKEVSVSGGAKEQTFEFRAFEYATNHYFVDTLYWARYEDYYNNEPPLVDANGQIVEEEVWVQRQGGIPDVNERQGIAFIDLPPRPAGAGYDSRFRTATDIPGKIESAPFVKLDRTQYELDGDGYLGVISFNTNVGDQLIVGVAYRRADGTQYGELIRNLGNDTTNQQPLLLKMVKPKNIISNGPSYAVAWKQLLKNVYPIPGIGRNLKKEGFALDIFRRVPGQEDVNNVLNEPLLRVFGLDQYTVDGAPAPNGDGTFDFRSGRTININRAEIIFPALRPFDTWIAKYYANKGTTIADSSEYRFKDIYDTTQTFAQQSLRNRWVMRGKAAGEATSRYSLGFNVVEGSVQVLLDGRQLSQNIDYTVDYIIGEVVIKNDKALVPGANLQIKYEQNDLFQLASKTLLGARGDLAFSPVTNLGFTIMNLNQQSLSDKVRLGEEPNNNTILGVDGSTTIDLPFLTRALDALPILQTKEASSLKVSGEAAYMLPDPNTRKSTIASDNNEGIAYIDDFEGSRRTTPVGIIYTGWTQASPPADSTWAGIPDSSKMFAKGKMIWFNRLPTDVRLTDIYPNKKVGNQANNLATVLDFRYFPSTRGMFNYSTNLSSTLTSTQNWGGVMKPLSISALNLTKENINFIELWIQIGRAPTDGTAKMMIDIGSISEDAIPNHILNSEDLILSQYPTGILKEGADLGLDMINDDVERQRYAAMVALYPEMGADPSGDNYAFTNATVGTPQEDFSRINGTEANRDGPSGRIPDTEDINGNGVLDQANSYFEYEVPLIPDPNRNPIIVGGGNLGWYQYRIPVREPARKVGSPTLENVEYIRVFFANSTDTIAIRVADFNLVGNQWQKTSSDQNDTSYSIAVVSVEETPGYQPPPGVIRERDKTQTDAVALANEQSLSLQLNGVPDGQSRQAVKFYTYRALDLFNYRTMKMFVRGDPRWRYVDPNNYDAEFFFRFGLDSLNFYEYRAPVHPSDPAYYNGWDPLNDVAIKFEDLTAIKQTRDSINVLSPPITVPGGPPGSFYRVLGNPSLTQIVYMAIGVENPRGKGTTAPLVGDLWVNELRLTSVDNTPGWAYRFDTQLKLADLGSVAFNYSKVDPFFHQLEQRFGNRQNSTNWALSTNVQLDRFLPEEMAGSQLGVSYSHTEGLTKSRYLPNSDVLVTKAADLARQRTIDKGGSIEQGDSVSTALTLAAETKRVTDTYAAPSFRIVIPSNAWYIRDTFNKLTYGFNYTKSNEHNPSTVYRTSWSWSARLSYAHTFSTDYFFQPFRSLFDGVWLLDDYKNLKIYYSPQSLSWNVTANRSRDKSLQRVDGATEIVSRNFAASRGFAFSWKFSEGGLINPFGDYTLSVESTLLDLELDQYGNQRPFSQILGEIFGKSKLINFGKDTRYSQRNTFNTKPNLPNLFNFKKVLDFSAGYSVDYQWQNALTRGDLGKSAGFSNTITFTMNFRVKQLFDPLFESAAPSSNAPPSSRGRRDAGTVPDTTVAKPDTTQPVGRGRAMDQIKNIFKVFVKIPFLEYDNVNVTFSQSNSAQNSGVIGGPGFVNFWGRAPFQDPDPAYGPSRLYQLGLISDPSGRLTDFHFTGKLPFVAWDVEPGLRAPGGVLMNSYRQTNRVTIKTGRALWEGARLDLNWNVGWSYNRTQNLSTDSTVGIPSISNTTTSGSVDRSFLTVPDVLVFGMFKSNIKEVSKRYGELKNDVADSRSDEEKLNQAFEDGMEALPLFRKLFGQLAPRVNWTLRWDGLEKIPLFANLATRVSLDHAYTSGFNRSFQNRPNSGGEQTDAERITYAFSPLLGVNVTFKELFKGNFGANVRYNSTVGYDLSAASRNLVESVRKEISLTASYTRKGFEIPFFGLSLNNDIDVSLSYSLSSDSRTTFDVSRLDVSVEGTPLEGSTRTVLEPRIKYILSSRVTASVYYRHTKVEPDNAGSRIPGITTNEAGLDLHIAIQ